MLTRIWQHRYQGLLATCLVGVAAAILVMLLPDRQQAFARFVLNPSVSNGAAANSLLDDQRIVTRVLQQIDIEPPNPVDPRPVDPIDAFKRNFALRETSQPGEFEVSYIGRSNDRALEGVSSWIQAATDLYGNEQASGAESNVSGELAVAQAKEQSLTRSVKTLQTNVTLAQEQLARFDSERAAADKELTAARASRERARQQQRRQAQESAGTQKANQKALAESLANRLAARKSAEKNLHEIQARLVESNARAGDSSDESAAAQARTDTRLLERQATAVQRELAQATERSEMLARRLSETPEKITEVVSEPAPVAPAVTANKAVLTREKIKLTELRVRFTDSHPDVRRQLAIIADLESPGESQVSQAPTVGARSVTKPNPAYQQVRAEQLKTTLRSDSLRERLREIETSREKVQTELTADNKDRVSGAARQQALRAELQQEVATAKSALVHATQQEEAASKALASIEKTESSPPQKLPAVTEPSATELATLKRKRQSLSDQVLSRQASELEAQEALALAREQVTQIAQQSLQPSSGGAAVAGLHLIQGPQVLPALSNPYRPQWLLAGLVGSLLVGALVSFCLALRRTAFHDLNELERITGLRALGAVPRFSSRGRLVRALISVLMFGLLILLYGLIYLAFIAMVEKGGAWWPIDWPGIKSTLFGLGQNGLTRLGIDQSWLNIGSEGR